jgi:hypothetical protein
MAIPSSTTKYYDALLTTTLENWLVTNAVDQIMTSNAFFHALNSKPRGVKVLGSLGERARIPLRYALGTPDAYGDYDALKNVPYDGLTTAFYDWRQASDAVQISGMEEAKNSGKEAVMNLLEEKKDQVMDGLKEWFAKCIMQGEGLNDTTSLITPYTSPSNGAQFIDPICLLIKYDPTSSTSIGNINQQTYTWWANQFKASAQAAYNQFWMELDELWMECGKGPGGKPDLHVCDENTFRFYLAALRSFHENPSYRAADIPFENVAFHGLPLVWDEFCPDAATGSTTLTTTSGTWFMINTGTFQLQVHAGTNFSPTPFVTPTNQDARVSHIMWKGALTCSARRKNGVLGAIDTTIVVTEPAA